MKNKKSPSNPIYERKIHDWARRAIARRLGLNTQFMPSKDQWGLIVRTIANIQPWEGSNGRSI